MEFLAQIVKVQAKTTISLDKQVSITILTGNLNALDLGKLPAMQNVKIRVELEGPQHYGKPASEVIAEVAKEDASERVAEGTYQ